MGPPCFQYSNIQPEGLFFVQKTPDKLFCLFCTSIAGGSKVLAQSRHGEDGKNMLSPWLTGPSVPLVGTRSGYPLTRGFYDSMNMTTHPHLHPAEVVWKEVQKNAKCSFTMPLTAG